MSLRESFSYKYLGNGSFGKSYRKKENRNFVAVKKISLQTEERENMERFCQEYKQLADALSTINHIVRVERVSFKIKRRGKHRLKCVTEFLDYNLHSFINREETAPYINLEKTIEIALQVANTLAFMHCSPGIPKEKLPVVHRHLSPNNILIRIEKTGKLRIKIADAGLAQTFEDCFDSMTIVANKNQHIYMAPELYGNICNKKMAFHYSPAVDVFSLGMILLEMCIGHPPEPFQTDQQVQSDVKKLANDHPLKELLTSCLSVDPNQRIKVQDIVQKLGHISQDGTAGEGTVAGARGAVGAGTPGGAGGTAAGARGVGGAGTPGEGGAAAGGTAAGARGGGGAGTPGGTAAGARGVGGAGTPGGAAAAAAGTAAGARGGTAAAAGGGTAAGARGVLGAGTPGGRAAAATAAVAAAVGGGVEEEARRSRSSNSSSINRISSSRTSSRTRGPEEHDEEQKE